MIRYLVFGIGDTKFWFYLRMFQFAYFCFLLCILYMLIVIVRPYKAHRQCADSSAKEVLAQRVVDSYGVYKSIYKDCIVKATQFSF